MKKVLKFNFNKHLFRLISLVVVVLILIALAGYFTFHKNKLKTISYQGTIYKQTCGPTKNGCTGYVLSVNNKQYNVVVPANTTIQSGTKVTVTSDSLASATSNQTPTIQAKSILPSNNSITSTTSSSSNTTTMTTTLPPVSPSYAKGNISITMTCTNLPAGATCASKPTPFQASVSVKMASTGVVITKFLSGSDGSFSVNLPAGSYVFVPDTYNNGSFKAPSQNVNIVSGQTTNISINYTGTAP